MTYNVKYASEEQPNSWPERRPVAQALLAAWMPDVVGLQEALFAQIKDLTAALPAYDWIGQGRDGGSKGEFLPVLYRKDRLDPVAFDHFWLSDTPERIASSTWGNTSNRMVTWVRFRDRISAREFYFVNLHLDVHSEIARQNSADLVLRRIREFAHDIPVLVGGDFNTQRGNFVYDMFVGPDALRDAWYSAGHPGELMSSSHGFLGVAEARRQFREEHSLPKDWLLTRGAVDVRSATIVTFAKNGQYPSDHFPVSFDLRWR
jgi:endonuclease/exonuclease/phosphatase family metal-dependent hydrolase